MDAAPPLPPPPPPKSKTQIRKDVKAFRKRNALVTVRLHVMIVLSYL